MEPMDENNSRKLECSHVFHTACLENWKLRMSTCPMCRKPFDQPNYRVKISIEPIGYEEIRTQTSQDIQNIINMFDLEETIMSNFITTLAFSLSGTTEVNDMLQEIGFGVFGTPGMDTSGFNTER